MAITDTLEQANSLLGEFPAFICVVDESSGKIAYANQAAMATLGEDIEGKSIDSINGGNTLLLHAGQKAGKRFEYNSCIHGEWHWISHYPAVVGGTSLHVFSGVSYSKLKNFDGLLTAGGETATSTALNRLEKQVSDYRKDQSAPFSVCHVDINGMKAVNDKLGHGGGDEYIKTVMRTIKSAIRATDIFTRADGDEFLIIFPNCSYSVVENIMCTVVNKLDLINTHDDVECNYSVSYGILEVDSLELAEVDTILATIKQRMRAMKEELAKTLEKN
jgi:diguanylate cyclase (GGDEF)-like protein